MSQIKSRLEEYTFLKQAECIRLRLTMFNQDCGNAEYGIMGVCCYRKAINDRVV